MSIIILVFMFGGTLIYAGLNDMTVTDALRQLLGRAPKGKLGGLGNFTDHSGAPAAGTSTSGTPTGSSGHLQSPFSHKMSHPTSVDDGVDFGFESGMRVGDPIMAPGDSILDGAVPGWGGRGPGGVGNAIFFRFAHGPVDGHYGWYVGEQINIKINITDTKSLIKAGTVCATFAASGSGIEWGFSGPGLKTERQAAGAAFGRPSKYGEAAYSFLKSVDATG